MKATNESLFTELTNDEAASVNGGDGISDYIYGVGGALGVPPEYYYYANQYVGAGLGAAYQQNGTLGQVDYLLGLVYNTDWFGGLI